MPVASGTLMDENVALVYEAAPGFIFIPMTSIKYKFDDVPV